MARVDSSEGKSKELQEVSIKMDKSIQIILNRNEDDIIKVLMGDFNTNMLKDKEDYENILNQGLLDTYQLAEKKDDGHVAKGYAHKGIIGKGVEQQG